jgi:hypothetical protein
VTARGTRLRFVAMDESGAAGIRFGLSAAGIELRPERDRDRRDRNRLLLIDHGGADWAAARLASF